MYVKFAVLRDFQKKKKNCKHFVQKGNVFLTHSMKSNRESGGTAPVIHNLGTKWGAPRTGRLYPLPERENPWYLFFLQAESTPGP